MTAPTPNAELAYKALDHIDAHPEEWDQATWHCGTAACFAGHALRLSGCQLERIGINGAIVAAGPAHLVGVEVEYAAYEVLGVPGQADEAGDDWLFDPDHSREDLGRLVAEIFGPRPGGEPS